MKTLLSLASLSIIFSGCNLFSSSAQPTPTPVLPAIMQKGNVLESSKSTEVPYQLYRLLASDPQNVNFSPLSLKIAFSLLYPGTEGDTKKLFEQMFAFREDDANPVRAEYDLAKKTEAHKGEAGFLEIHNSMWSKRSGEIKPSFLEALKLQEGEVEKLNLDAMNAWVAKATQNKIPKLIDSLPINTNTILINTLYFKAKWAKPFEVAKSSITQFQAGPHLSQNVMTLHDQREVAYFEDAQAKWIALPYEGLPFTLYLALPIKRFDLRNLEEKISSESFAKMVSQMKKASVLLAIPRFKFSQKTSLRSLLTNAGYGDLFTKGDYSGILGSHKLVLSDVLQAASIEVNETGTEASAATGIMLRERAMMVDPVLSKSFIADQPFMFILRNETTKEIYWLGRVYAPLGTQN